MRRSLVEKLLAIVMLIAGFAINLAMASWGGLFLAFGLILISWGLMTDKYIEN